MKLYPGPLKKALPFSEPAKPVVSSPEKKAPAKRGRPPAAAKKTSSKIVVKIGKKGKAKQKAALKSPAKEVAAGPGPS